MEIFLSLVFFFAFYLWMAIKDDERLKKKDPARWEYEHRDQIARQRRLAEDRELDIQLKKAQIEALKRRGGRDPLEPV